MILIFFIFGCRKVCFMYNPVIIGCGGHFANIPGVQEFGLSTHPCPCDFVLHIYLQTLGLLAFHRWKIRELNIESVASCILTRLLRAFFLRSNHAIDLVLYIIRKNGKQSPPVQCKCDSSTEIVENAPQERNSGCEQATLLQSAHY